MSEVSLHLAKGEALDRLPGFLAHRTVESLERPGPTFGFEEQGWSRFVRANRDWLPQSEVSRIYLGNEFCKWLQPEPEEEEESFKRIESLGLKATLVLPVVTQSMLESTLERIAVAARRSAGFEVVCNDWGTAAAVGERGLDVVAGRFLFRMKRMPRVTNATLPEQSGTPGPEEMLGRQMRELLEHPINTRWFADFLRGLGISRLDCELTPNGHNIAPHDGVSLSLIAPWSYVTGGGICPLQKLVVADGREVCTRRCRNTWLEPAFPTQTRPVVQLGHTVFSKFEHCYKLSGKLFDRIVLEPWLPM